MSQPRANEPLICVLVQAWPRVATTFVAQELVGLEQLGFRFWLGALREGEQIRHGLHDQLQAAVFTAPRPFATPLRALRDWAAARRLPGYRRARELFRADYRRAPGVRRIRLFLKAMRLALELPPEARLIYAQFIDQPGAAARYVAAMRQLPLVASAHARDIWVTSDWEKREMLAEARWITTCNGPGADVLRRLTDAPDKVLLIYHGLSLQRFPSAPLERPARDGSDPDDPVRLLSVGRAVEKKGFDVLLDALSRLPSGLHWRWGHVGDGVLLDKLKARGESLGLADRIDWHGAQPQETVIGLYRSSDLFVLPAREASDGDRDGLPNVLMEAQSQALACVSTSFSAIPELIVDGETGLLVPPGDPGALAAALEQLIRSPARRAEIGIAGCERVRRDFQAEVGIARIADLLRSAMT